MRLIRVARGLRWRALVLLVALAVLLPSVPLPPATAGVNSWSPMTLPYVMNVTALAVSPAYPCDKTVFMGTDGHGVFRTTDSSVDSVWAPVNNGLYDQGILALAISPNYGRCDRLSDRGDRTIIVATRSGIFRTINGGASWEVRSQGLPEGQAVQSLVISPNYASDRTVYAGFDGSLFRSTDGAATWTAFDAGLTDRSVQAFAPSANYANDNTLFVGTRFSGVYRIASRLQEPAATVPVAPQNPPAQNPPGGTPPSPAPPSARLTQSQHTSGKVSVEVVGPPSGDGSTLKQSSALTVPVDAAQRAAPIHVILWACNADGSLCADDGAEWTTVPGLVTLKMEIKNVSTDTTLRNILVTDDSGTPDNTSDDLLVNAGNPQLEVVPGSSTVVQRQLVVNSNRGADGTAPFRWKATAMCGATFEECGVTATDDALVRVVSAQSRPSIRVEINAGSSFYGQTYYTVPGTVPLNLRVINDGNEAVRNVQLILDPASNDNPGCTDNPATPQPEDETLDDVDVGTIPSLGPGQQTTLTTNINVKPVTESSSAGTTFQPTRIQGCAVATAGVASSPVRVFSNGDVLIQLVTWQSITPSGSALSNLWVTSFATSPFYANDQTIFAGTSYGGLYRSTDAATSRPTWELVNQGLDPTFTWIRAISLSPRYAFDRTLFVGTESGVFRGVESGPGGPISWTPLNRGLPVKDVRALGISPDYGRDNVIFAGAYGSDVFRLKATSDEIPWEAYRRVVNGLWAWSLGLTPEGVLLQGTWGRGIGRTVLTTGSEWSYAQPGFPGDAEVTVLAASHGYCSGYTTFAGTWAHGLYRSLDAGGSWAATGYQTGYGPIRDVAVAPSYARGHALAVASWGGGVLISHNDGATWTPINAGLGDLKVRSVAFSPGYPEDETLFAGTDGAGLFRYDPPQGRWVPAGTGLPGGAVMDVELSPLFLSDNTVAVATWGSGVFLSRDRGATWSATGGQVNPFVRTLSFSPNYGTDGTLYAGTNKGLFRSADRGGNWGQIGGPNEEVTNTDVTGLAVTTTLPRTIFVSTGGRGVWQYTDTTVSSYQINQLVYRAFIPIMSKGRPGNVC